MTYTIRNLAVLISIFMGLLVASYLYLHRALPEEIKPADLACLAESDGVYWDEYIQYKNIYGIGLSYANHINETASNFDPDMGPPVFEKSLISLTKNGSNVTMPSQQQLLQSVESVEQGIIKTLEKNELSLSALLDHEVELAFVLLENITNEQLNRDDFIPKLGLFIANDLSARSIAILGEGQNNRFDYWGASKSFYGFTPMSSGVWVANNRPLGGIPCVELQTYVNEELRQSEYTHNLIYRPIEMLRAILRNHPSRTLSKGDIVLTGTPGGVISNVPRWKVRAAELLGFDRLMKLRFAQKSGSADKFLKAGDSIRISGGWLGEVNTSIVK